MSTLNTNFFVGKPIVKDSVGGIKAVPELLSGSLGSSVGGGFLGSTVDRALVGIRDYGTGEFAFGSMDTPQANIINWKLGYLHSHEVKADPSWTSEQARKMWGAVPDDAKVAVDLAGGKDLLESIFTESKSVNDMFNRVSQINEVVRARLAVDKYDAQTNMIGYGFIKTTSALSNYIFADPITAVTIIATAGLATPEVALLNAGRASMAAGESVSLGMRVAITQSNYSKTFKAANYLWNMTDAASMSYSGWDARHGTNEVLYGKTAQSEGSWVPEVAMGVGMGLGFTFAGDMLGAIIKRGMRGEPKSAMPISGLENIAAQARQHMQTGADFASESKYISAKAGLSKALAATESDTHLRAILMDDNQRALLGWGGHNEMTDLTDWIIKNKPSSDEIGEYVGERMRVRALQHAETATWAEQHANWVAGGEDGAIWWSKQAHAQIERAAGPDAAKYRFLVKYLEDATGSIESAARYLARADKQTLERTIGAINQIKAMEAVENSVLNVARKKVKDLLGVAHKSRRDALMEVYDEHIANGRWSGAIEQLNIIHDATVLEANKMVANAQVHLDEANVLFSSMNHQARRANSQWGTVLENMEKLKAATAKWTTESQKLRRNALNTTLNADATVADVLSQEATLLGNGRYRVRPSEEMYQAWFELRESLKALRSLHEETKITQWRVRPTERMLNLAGAIERSVSIEEGFPLIRLGMTDNGWEHMYKVARGRVEASNRWRIQMVDNLMGEGTADNALESGSFPLRPVRNTKAQVLPPTYAEQDAILKAELDAAAPQMNAIREAADNADMTTRADRHKLSATFGRDLAAKIQKMIDDKTITGNTAKVAASKIKKLTKAADSADAMARRLEKDAAVNAGTLIPPQEPKLSVVSSESIAAAKRNAAEAASDELKKQVDSIDPAEINSKVNRQIRTDARKAAAAIQGGTKFNQLNREGSLIEEELTKARAETTRLVEFGSVEGDPLLKAARSNEEYLLKAKAKNIKSLAAIDKRAAMVIRAGQLAGVSPHIIDVLELTMLRVKANIMAAAGDTAGAEEYARRMFEQFGDVRRLPRWVELEDDLGARVSHALGDTSPTHAGLDALDGTLNDVGDTTITELKMNGRELVMTRQPKVVAEGAAAESTTLRVNSSDPAIGTPAEATVKTTPAGVTNGTSATPVVTAANRISQELGANSKGDRLLIANGAVAAMAQIPALRGLGNAMLRFITSGTRFGELHTIGPDLSMIVEVFNMLDSPEATVSSLGLKTTVAKTFQHFKDRGNGAVMHVIGTIQRNQQHFTVASMDNIGVALRTGDHTALSAAEREVATVVRSYYEEGRQAIMRSTGRTNLPENWTPRMLNANLARNNSQAVIGDFHAVFLERMQQAAALPHELCDALGIGRGRSWASLSDAERATFLPRLNEEARDLAAETFHAQTGGLVEGEGGRTRRATGRQLGEFARTLEDEVVNDPRIARWYITDPLDNLHMYATRRMPELMFNDHLSTRFGGPTSFKDVIQSLKDRLHAANVSQDVLDEAQAAITHLQEKYDYATGRFQYNPHMALEGGLRTANGVLRGSSGAFWGMAGVATEVNRAWAASKMFGGSRLAGIGQVLYAMARSGLAGELEDVAHAIDQYATMAHSAGGPTIGLTWQQRFMAPWERFIGNVRGTESVTAGRQSFGRAASSVIAFAEAYGETGTRAGGMQWASGVARCVADRLAKRFLTANIQNMRNLVTRLEAIGAVTENTPGARAAFKAAAAECNIPWEVAVRLNHRGVLRRGVIDSLETAIQGEGAVFRLNQIRGRLNDDAFSSVADFLTDAHNYHVPVQSLATSVAARGAIEKLYFNLTSYARGFALNVGFRNIAAASGTGMLATFATVAFGENLYQQARSMALGKKTWDEIQQEYEDNPTGTFFKNTLKSPWLGAHNTTALAAVDKLTPLDLNQGTRGNEMFGPLFSVYQSAAKSLNGPDKFGKSNHDFLKTYTPIINAWYSRLGIGLLEG